MKKLLTGLVVGVATITLGASCVLAATQLQDDNSTKESSFPICYPNCNINYIDSNENGICDNAEEGICPSIQNVETIVNEPSIDEQSVAEQSVAEQPVAEPSVDYQENAQTNESNYEVNQDVELQYNQQPSQPYYCPDCGSNYVDNNGNGICDNVEEGICPPAQNTGIQGGNQSGYCPNNCGANYVDNNGNGICDNIEQGTCPPAQNGTGNGYYGHHGGYCNGYTNTQQNNNYNYGHHGGHCRR